MPKNQQTKEPEIAEEVFKKLRTLFERTTPHASFTALLRESREPEHSVFTDEALQYWLAPFEHHKKKTPELEGATRIQAYVNFSLLNKIQQELEKPPHFARTIDEAAPNYRKNNVVNSLASFCLIETQVEEICRPRIMNTKPMDMQKVWQEELKRRKMKDDNHVLQQVLLGIIGQSDFKSSLNATEVINAAISKLSSDAWEGLERRPNWRGRSTGVLSERRTAARFEEIRDVLEMPAFESVGDI